MIRLAVVGTGKIVKEFLPYLYDMPEVKPEIICSTKRSRGQAEEYARKYEIPCVFDDYDDMLAHMDEYPADVIYIATPNSMHYEMAEKALLAGRNLFIEKPFATRYEDAERIAELAREKKLFALEAITTLHLDIFRKMKELLPTLGQIRYADCNFSQYSSKYDQFLAGQYFTILDPDFDGGALMDMNVYSLHTAAGLFGRPESVTYTANYMNNGTLKRPVDMSGTAVLKYPDHICTCTAAKDSQGPSRVLVQGTKGYLELIAPVNSLTGTLVHYDHETKTREAVMVNDGSLPRLYPEFRELDRILREKDFAEAELLQEESLAVCEMLDLCRRFFPEKG